MTTQLAESEIQRRLPAVRQRKPKPKARTPVLTVIIPVYNESATLDELLGRVIAAPYSKQVIVVDDGSRDGTEAVLRRWADRREVEVLTHATNAGKGRAIRTALANARGAFVIVQDADLEYDPRDYVQVIEPLRDGTADVVFGSRYLEPSGGEWRRARWVFRTGIRVLNLAVRLLFRVRLSDEATCYKAMRTDLLRALELECERFEFCPEVTAKVCRLGARIMEVPVSYSPRDFSNGKKIRWTDGIAALQTLWQWRRWEPAATTRASFGRPAGTRALTAIAGGLRRMMVRPQLARSER